MVTGKHQEDLLGESKRINLLKELGGDSTRGFWMTPKKIGPTPGISGESRGFFKLCWS